MASVYQSSIESIDNAAVSNYLGAPFAALAGKYVPASTTLSVTNYLKTGGSSISNFFTQTIPNTVRSPYTPMKIFLILLVLLAIVTGCFFLYNYIVKSSENFENRIDRQNAFFKNLMATINTKVNALTASQKQITNVADTSTVALKNIQPICFPQASFLTNDTFDSDQGILQQLRVGARTFFFQIDYIEAESLNPEKFCDKYVPCLLIRDNNGRLISKNSSSLTDTFSSLFKNYNSDLVSNHTYPVVIMLHFVRIPGNLYSRDDKEVTKYTTFLSNVADSMKAISGNLASDYYKANKEVDLFSTQLLNLNAKMIVGTNIDTSMSSLDNNIHFHYYVTENEKVDITYVVPQSVIPNALIFNANTLLMMDDSTKQRWIQTHNNIFTIIKPLNQQTLTQQQVDILLNEFQVNVILYDYFNGDNNTVQSVINLYDAPFILKNSS